MQALIDKTRSIDPWDLVAAGAETDRQYLSKIIAAAILMKNPKLVD